MSYEVTIIEKRETLKPNPKYRGERPRHYDTVFNEGDKWPDPQIVETEERIALQQNFDELDLTAVIKVLNKIK